MRYLVVLAAGMLTACAMSSPALTAETGLGGSSWQLVQFQGGDGKILKPDDKSRYTLTFATDGRVTARIDCNRGQGGWESTGPNQVRFGPLALTRAQCPPESLHDQIVRHWPYFRSYVIRNGHLYLSLMADGGIYEFEPLPSSGKSAAPDGPE